MDAASIRIWFKTHKIETLILFLFAVIYSLVSLVNHYNLRTSALDLGMFNHALYSFSHGKMNYFTLDLSGKNPMYFADHFSPITLLYAPFYYVFGSWTLLLIQIFSVLFGAIGCLKITELKLPTLKYKYLILLIFLGQWAIISALSFDFHNNVVGAMLVPWLYYYYLKNERLKFILFFVLILITKENMALWLVFILIGFSLEKGIKYFLKNWKAYLKFELPLLLIAFVYFYLVVSMIMPKLSHGEALNQISRFGSLGSSVGEIIKNILFHPIDTIKLLFYSNLEDPGSFGIKKELHVMILLSGGIALILRPAYLLMLVPIYAQKLLCDNYALWGIRGQYSIEFTPILTLAIIDLIGKIRSLKVVHVLLFSSSFLVLYANYSKMKKETIPWCDTTTSNIFSSEHYNSGGLNLKYIKAELNKIPDGIPLSVSTFFAPHLANRDHLYHFPITQDAELIVLIKSKRSTYPLSKEEFDKKVDALLQSGLYTIKLDKNDLLILKRSKNN